MIALACPLHEFSSHHWQGTASSNGRLGFRTYASVKHVAVTSRVERPYFSYGITAHLNIRINSPKRTTTSLLLYWNAMEKGSEGPSVSANVSELRRLGEVHRQPDDSLSIMSGDR